MITCLCVEAEWLRCFFMPILGPEEKDKAVLRLDDGSISGHSGGLQRGVWGKTPTGLGVTLEFSWC